MNWKFYPLARATDWVSFPGARFRVGCWAACWRRSRKAAALPSICKKRSKKNADNLEKWEAFCKEMGKPPAEVALAWVMNNPVVTAPIIGPRTMEHLTSALKAAKIRFKKDELKKIDEIWPGPGGAAPEAYAW